MTRQTVFMWVTESRWRRPKATSEPYPMVLNRLHGRPAALISGVIIEQIFTSPGHNYFGHYNQEPADFPLEESIEVECVAGRGLRGDRFFDFKDEYKGQITFFARETFDLMAREFAVTKKSPGVLRRNVVVSGIELNDLIGAEFELQGVRFQGTAHCAPCDWMNRAFAPGAKKFLANRGGLRARILSDGSLRVGDARLRVLSRLEEEPA